MDHRSPLFFRDGAELTVIVRPPSLTTGRAGMSLDGLTFRKCSTRQPKSVGVQRFLLIGFIATSAGRLIQHPQGSSFIDVTR